MGFGGGRKIFLVPKLRAWAHTLPGKLCFRGGAADAAVPPPHREAELPLKAGMPKPSAWARGEKGAVGEVGVFTLVIPSFVISPGHFPSSTAAEPDRCGAMPLGFVARPQLPSLVTVTLWM